jgi:hypothetical protein
MRYKKNAKAFFYADGARGGIISREKYFLLLKIFNFFR